MSAMRSVRQAGFVFGLIVAMPAGAQQATRIDEATGAPIDQSEEEAAPQPLPPLQTRPAEVGRVAESAVGEVGQRDVRGRAPLARVSSRIQNRVQSRFRNRIDRNYDPQANATSPFITAEDQARVAGRPRS